MARKSSENQAEAEDRRIARELARTPAGPIDSMAAGFIPEMHSASGPKPADATRAAIERARATAKRTRKRASTR